jgi:ABC-type lipoprotein release transport system permease subunit
MSFVLGYVAAELTRRRGRALLTAFGLGLGIALVVAVTALQHGVDDAQDQVFAPLAGIGTDVLISRPIELQGDGIAAFATLPRDEQRALRAENEDAFVDPATLGEPGDPFEADSFLPATQLTFPEALSRALRTVEEVEAVGRALTVLLVHAEGEVPQQVGNQRPTFQGGDIAISTATVAGIESARQDLGLITPAQLTEGRFLRAGANREVLLAEAYAARRKLGVGDTLELDGRRFDVVGLVAPPVGGQAADLYLDLPVLQRVADREGRVNLLLVRARDAGDVAALAREAEKFLPGLAASSSRELAGTVEGSLIGAGDLSERLGLLLAIVALVAAVGIAALLVLSGVAKRTRELGTLRAMGWSRSRVVGVVLCEALALGVLGAIIGAGLGVGAAALVSELVPPLEATAERAGGLGSIFGSGEAPPPTASIPLDAPVDASLLLLAAGLSLAAGLLAGLAGAVRAARLRPAEALRRLD